jgi:hypothetical protein
MGMPDEAGDEDIVQGGCAGEWWDHGDWRGKETTQEIVKGLDVEGGGSGWRRRSRRKRRRKKRKRRSKRTSA